MVITEELLANRDRGVVGIRVRRDFGTDSVYLKDRYPLPKTSIQVFKCKLSMMVRFLQFHEGEAFVLSTPDVIDLIDCFNREMFLEAHDNDPSKYTFESLLKGAYVSYLYVDEDGLVKLV